MTSTDAREKMADEYGTTTAVGCDSMPKPANTARSTGWRPRAGW
jgi:hypothetical protein